MLDKEARNPRKAQRRRPGTSQRRLDDLKRLIESGQYESEEKLEVALRRMLPDLRGFASRAGASPEDDTADGSP